MEVVMRVPPPHVPLNSTQLLKTQTPVGKRFKSTLSTAATKRSSLGSLPISNAELKDLALDLKNGIIDKEEANNRFVKTVINNSIRKSLGEKDREELIQDIKNFFANDPDFVTELAKNLSFLV
jgi:hypothetical protein